jgi:hypothetical protein
MSPTKAFRLLAPTVIPRRVETGNDRTAHQPLYSNLDGAGALQVWVQGTDDVSRATISN